MHSAPNWHGSEFMELTFPGFRGVDAPMSVDSPPVTDEGVPPTDHLGIQAAVLWLVVGSAMVATAIVAVGLRRTIEIWGVSGVLLPLVFAGERLWYKYVLKSD